MKKSFLPYLAGIIDGEGTVNIVYLSKRNEYRLRIYVVNTDKRLLDWLHKNFDGYVYFVKRHKILHPNWKDKYEWFLYPNKNNISLLQSLIPYLVCKKDQMKVAIRFAKTLGKGGGKLSKKTFNIRAQCKKELGKLNGTLAVAETE